MNLNREELYELLSSKPPNVVAASYGTTVPVLRQLFLDRQIPWPSDAFKSDTTDLSKDDTFDLQAAIASARNSLLFAGETGAIFTVPNKLSDPDPLIKAAGDSVKKDWQYQQMPHMVRAGNGIISIRSSKNNWDRALRIMDTLVKIWRARGYRIGYQDKETKVYLSEVSLSVSLRETTTVEASEERYGSQIHSETGLLAFKVKGWGGREWKDGRVLLETHIQEICDHMEVAARDLENIWAERRLNEQKERQAQQALAERIQADATEKAAFETLLAEAQHWHQLQILDQYLDHLQQRIPRSPAFEQWLQWARHRRRLFDPTEKHKTT